MLPYYSFVYFDEGVSDFFPFHTFHQRVNKPLLYNVPSIIEYELTLLFTMAASAGLEESGTRSIYFAMGDIQEYYEMSSMIIIIAFGVSMLGPLSVFWMKE